MAALMVQSVTHVIYSESFKKLHVHSSNCCSKQRCKVGVHCSGGAAKCMKVQFIFGKSYRTRRPSLSIVFALDMGDTPTPDNGSQGSLADGENSGLGGTRLGRIVRAGSRQLLEKLNAARKNFPMKIFLLLLGFYTANALATILGQTGDWDVLVAGVVVAAIEGIGMLMYKKPMSAMANNGKLQSLVVMVNFWKAGVCLGLFVDAFKLGS